MIDKMVNSTSFVLGDQSLDYMFDTEIIPKTINQGENIIYFRNNIFPDGSEKKFGTDYQIPGNTLGLLPMGHYFKFLGFGYDFEMESSVDDINKIRNSSNIVVIVGGQFLAIEAPLKWFSWIVDKPILDIYNVKLPPQTAFKVELRFNNKENLSKDVKFGLIIKSDHYSSIR